LGFGILILYLIITVVRQSLEPRVVGKQIGLYPLITLICMFVGASLFGFFGLFGLPIAATVFVQMRRDKLSVH
ncbi:MAG: AI-2E family transporter, partial [Ruthenibacterium sp.]